MQASAVAVVILQPKSEAETKQTENSRLYDSHLVGAFSNGYTLFLVISEILTCNRDIFSFFP